MVHEMKQFRFVLMRSKCTSQVSHSTNHWLLKLILQLRVSYSGSDFVTFRSHGGKSSTFAGFFLLASNFTALTSNLVYNGESEMGKKIETQIPFAEIICPLVVHENLMSYVRIKSSERSEIVEYEMKVWTCSQANTSVYVFSIRVWYLLLTVRKCRKQIDI